MCSLQAVELIRLEECLRYEQWENDTGITGHLDRLSIHTNFAPRNSLIWPGPGIAAVKLLSCVYEDSIVCAISHQVGIAYVVLWQP